MQWKWHAAKSVNNYYAARAVHDGYVNGKRRQKRICMHNAVAERAGLDTSNLIDHINRNGLDNQRDNLRPATRKQNAENIGLPKNNTSGHKGVSWNKRDRKWQAHIVNNGKLCNLGYFDNKEDAIKARKEAEKKHYTHSDIG